MKPRLRTAIEGEIRERVTAGVWARQGRLPSGQEMAREFDVSPSTIDKVLTTLKEEGLIHSRQGKGYFSTAYNPRRRTYTVGMLYYASTPLDHPITLQWLAGVQQHLAASSYHMKLFTLPRKVYPSELPHPLPIDIVDVDSVDAILNQCHLMYHEALVDLATRVPVVCVDQHLKGPGFGSVRFDYASGAFDLASHLLEAGHRNLLLLTTGAHAESVYARELGIRLALRGADARLRVEKVPLWDEASGAEGARRWLAGSRAETVIVCASDELALGAYRALAADGVRVPDDVALTSWNDFLTTHDIPVPLTTVKLDFRASGARCAEEALRLSGEPKREGCDILLPVKLEVRASSALPRRRREP